jgi:hypothetical protein
VTCAASLLKAEGLLTAEKSIWIHARVQNQKGSSVNGVPNKYSISAGQPLVSIDLVVK